MGANKSNLHKNNTFANNTNNEMLELFVSENYFYIFCMCKKTWKWKNMKRKLYKQLIDFRQIFFDSYSTLSTYMKYFSSERHLFSCMLLITDSLKFITQLINLI